MGAPDDPGTARARKLAAKRANERIRLLAGFLNALAIAVVGASFIVPVIGQPDRLLSPNLAWLVLGSILHLVAQGVFAFLRSED